MLRRTTPIVLTLLAVGCAKEPAAPAKKAEAQAAPKAAEAAPAMPGMPGPSSAGLSAEAQAGHRLYAVCHSCHDPALVPPQGPPMFGLQRRYKRATDDKAAFVTRMVKFVETPSAETAIMVHAVENMGLMPALPLGKAPLAQIAAYIYEAKFEPPCAHWKFALENEAKKGGGDDEHMRQDNRMYEKFCK